MHRLFALALCALLAGCCLPKPGPAGPPPPPFIPTTIAVLPFDNATASVEAPKNLREALYVRVGRKGYIVKPVADVDRVLESMGIQLGGQIKGVPLAELHEKLGVDMVLTGTVLEASALTTGIVNRRKVEAEVALFDLRLRTETWKRRRTYAGLGDDGDNVVSSLVVGLAKSGLKEEHGKLADIIVNEMPWCPREAPPPPLPPPPPGPVSP